MTCSRREVTAFPDVAAQGVVSRRAAMTCGAAGLAAAGSLWDGWLRAAEFGAAASTPAGRSLAKAVILIFNAGAPSHLDLWDPKPNAPEGVRGLFRPIATRTSGVQFSELLPRMAQRSDKLAVLRTVHHTQVSHNAGMYWSIVGRPYRVDQTQINPSRSDFPSFGTLTGWLARRDGYTGALPPYVITPRPHCDSPVFLTPGQFGSCLGAKYDPLVVQNDPNAANFHVANLQPQANVSPERMRSRRGLCAALNRATSLPTSGVPRELEAFSAQALSLMTSPAAAEAFDLSREPAAVRERYGRHSWGQSHLLARRLVEAGVRFVTTVNGPSITWDTHKDNFNQMQKRLVPPMEQAYAALLDDLHERGLLDTTLVVWMGDFGRTPTINKDAGRDHWPQCYSMVLAGGGVRGGQVIGESDRHGAFPRLRPITPADVHATVFTLLGYDPHQITYQTPEGRPTPLSDGTPIGEVLA